MLPSNRRLTTELFNEAIAGRAFHSPSISLKVVQSSGKTRLAVAASKKNFKTAVSRNSARRRIYSAISTIVPSVAEGFFVVVMAKPEISKLKMPELRSALASIFMKAGIMKKS